MAKHCSYWRNGCPPCLIWITKLLTIIIGSSGGSSPQGGLGSGPRCGTGSLGQYKTPGMRHSVWDGLWRPGGAFFQIGLGCVMSHHPIEGLCAAGNDFMRVWTSLCNRESFSVTNCWQELHFEFSAKFALLCGDR